MKNLHTGRLEEKLCSPFDFMVYLLSSLSLLFLWTDSLMLVTHKDFKHDFGHDLYATTIGGGGVGRT